MVWWSRTRSVQSRLVSPSAQRHDIASPRHCPSLRKHYACARSVHMARFQSVIVRLQFGRFRFGRRVEVSNNDPSNMLQRTSRIGGVPSQRPFFRPSREQEKLFCSCFEPLYVSNVPSPPCSRVGCAHSKFILAPFQSMVHSPSFLVPACPSAGWRRVWKMTEDCLAACAQRDHPQTATARQAEERCSRVRRRGSRARDPQTSLHPWIPAARTWLARTLSSFPSP